MTLLIQCPICSQSLVFRGNHHTARAECPVCQAPMRVCNPRLPEHEILGILTNPATDE
jgi:hypothetical protein